jgi:hypothetical protein
MLGVSKCLTRAALVGLQKVSQGFTQVAVIVPSESRQDAVALFVQIDLPPDHGASLAQRSRLNTTKPKPRVLSTTNPKRVPCNCNKIRANNLEENRRAAAKFI